MLEEKVVSSRLVLSHLARAAAGLDIVKGQDCMQPTPVLAEVMDGHSYSLIAFSRLQIHGQVHRPELLDIEHVHC
jgi:hypothetical protein